MLCCQSTVALKGSEVPVTKFNGKNGLDVVCLTVSMFATNCYLVFCTETREAVVIDPGANGKGIIEKVKSYGLSIKYIINTHAHVDHIGANGKIKETFKVPILLGEKDLQIYEKPAFGLSLFFKKQPKPDRLISEGTRISFGRVYLDVLETPGHSPGSISLLSENAVFCGDTLFSGSIGRTDLPGGSHEQLIKSIHEKLLVLQDHVVIYPGHGPITTPGNEIFANPFIDLSG